MLAEHVCTSRSIKSDCLSTCPGRTAVYGPNNHDLRSIKKTEPHFSNFSTSNHSTCSLVHQHIFQQFHVVRSQALPSLATSKRYRRTSAANQFCHQRPHSVLRVV